jgi:CBS domain-containing protein
MKKIREIMTTNVDYCTTVDNMYEAAVKMQQDDVGMVPVCEDGRLVGVITDRDIVLRGVASKKPGSTKITDVMTKKLITVSPETSIEEAEEIMANEQIRRLPVVDNEKLVGIVSLGDLAVNRTTDQQAGMVLSEVSENRDHLQH